MKSSSVFALISHDDTLYSLWTKLNYQKNCNVDNKGWVLQLKIGKKP